MDLYFTCKKAASLEEILRLYDKKYKNLAATQMHIMKSLVYLNDAEPEEMPEMLEEVSWGQIKGYFENEVKKLVKRA